MGGRFRRCLLALTTIQQFFAIASASSDPELCESYAEEIAPLVCGQNYICRHKCNMTVDELRRNGIQQECHCDARCVLFDDCCWDFASTCSDLFREGKRKYMEFDTICFNGGMTVLTGIIDEKSTFTPGTSLSSTSVTEETTGRFRVSAEPYKEESPSWAQDLLFISQIKIDYGRRIVFARWLYISSPRTLLSRSTFSPVQVFTVVLGASKPFSHVEFLSESDEFVSVRSLVAGIPKSVVRECSNKQVNIKCPDCSDSPQMKSVCRGVINENARNGSLDSDKDENAETASCVSSITDDDRQHQTNKNEQSVDERLVEVTVIPDPVHGNTTLLSKGLPWADIQCIENEEFAAVVCEIESCAMDRVLSPDGRACFVPTHISVEVVKRAKTVNESNTSSSLPLQQHETTSTTLSTSQSRLDMQNVTADHKVPVSNGFCLGLYQLLVRHTLWIFERFYYIHPTCRYDLNLKPTPNTRRRNDSVENSEQFSPDTVSSSFSKSHGSAPNSHQDNGHASHSQAGNKHQPHPLNQANYKDGMQRVRNLIHDNVDTLPATGDLLSVTVCFETDTKFSCPNNEDPESCRDRLYRCFSYMFQNDDIENTMNSSHSHLPWGWWINLTLLLPAICS